MNKESLKKIVCNSNFLYSIACIFLKFIAIVKPVRGKHNHIYKHGIFHKVSTDIKGNNNSITISSGCIIKNTKFYIRGNNNTILLEEGCYFSGGSFWIEGSNGKIILRKNTSVVSAHLCVQEKDTAIEIGEDCMFSNNIIIRTSDSHPLFNKLTNERLNKPASVKIGDHVWLAAKVTVMKGVSIGKGSIVGYGTIVTKDQPEDSLIIGAPARVVKNGVYWTREKLF